MATREQMDAVTVGQIRERTFEYLEEQFVGQFVEGNVTEAMTPLDTLDVFASFQTMHDQSRG